MKKIYFLLIIFFISCNEQPNVTNKANHDDTIKAKLIGQWGDLKTLGWDIKKDSIYYFERLASYPYKILNNNLIIDLPESKGTLRNIRVIKDTFFWLDEQGLTVKAYRMKKKSN